MRKASTVFGRLTKRVWKNQHLSFRTKVRVYEACDLSILLYGAVTWVTYRQQESRLIAFHTRYLRFRQTKTWKDKITNEKLFEITGSTPFSSLLKFYRLSWAGYLNRMPSPYIPRLHRVLEEGSRPVGRPHIRYKDVLKRNRNDFSIRPYTWNAIACDRSGWKNLLHTRRTHDSRKILNELRDSQIKQSSNLQILS